MHVAVSATPSSEDHISAHVSGHVHDDLSGIGFPDHCALRHLDLDITAFFAGHSLFFAVFPVLGGILAHMSEIRERIEAFVHDKDDISAFSSVAAVGSACRHIFFPAEGDMSVPALSAADYDSGFIDKHVLWSTPLGKCNCGIFKDNIQDDL